MNNDIDIFISQIFTPHIPLVSGGVIAICLVLLIIIYVRFLLPRSLTL